MLRILQLVITLALVSFCLVTPHALAQPLEQPKWYPEQVEDLEKLIGEELLDDEQKTKFGKWLKDKDFKESWFIEEKQRKKAEEKLTALGVDTIKLRDKLIFLFASSSPEQNAEKQYCGGKSESKNNNPSLCIGFSIYAGGTRCRKNRCCAKNRCSTTCKLYYEILKCAGNSPEGPCSGKCPRKR